MEVKLKRSDSSALHKNPSRLNSGNYPLSLQTAALALINLPYAGSETNLPTKRYLTLVNKFLSFAVLLKDVARRRVALEEGAGSSSLWYFTLKKHCFSESLVQDSW